MWNVGRRAADFGLPPDPHQVWRYEAASLDQLQPLAPPSRVLHPSVFTDRTARAPPYARHPYVASIAETTDGALLALMTSDARVELHQPPDPHRPLPLATPAPGDAAAAPVKADSLRLAINPADTAARAADVCWHPRGDTLVLGMSDRAALWSFDVETCSDTAPTRVHALRGGGSRGVTDLAALPLCGAIAAACTDGPVHLLDSRARNVSASIAAPTANNVLAAADPLLFVCGAGCIRAYDVRALSHSDAGGARSLARLQLASAAAVPVRDRAELESAFSFAHALHDGTHVAFQTATGIVGLACMMTGTAELVPEPPPQQPQEAVPDSGLYALGARERHAQEYPWYVARRRGVVVRGGGGRGWRVIAPCVGRPAFRVVPLGLPRPKPAAAERASGKLRRLRAGAPFPDTRRAAPTTGKVVDTPAHVACVTADDQLHRFVLGYAGNAADVYQVSTDLVRAD
jgi:hypothetical protein